MEEVQRENVLYYLERLQELGPEQFLESYPHPVLLENYLALSSRIKLARVETISELEVKEVVSATGALKDETLLQTRVIPLEKRDKHSSERMIFVGRSANNDIVILNKMVSKLHAYFCLIPGSQIMQLVDMNSTNGTFVNDSKQVPSVRVNLNDEDLISFGPETKLEYLSAAGFSKLLQQLNQAPIFG